MDIYKYIDEYKNEKDLFKNIVDNYKLFKYEERNECMDDTYIILNDMYNINVEMDYENIGTTRHDQQKFRDRLVEKYKCCVITGYDSSECQACHIIPYSETKDSSTDNGLLLHDGIHGSFDKYIWSINPNTMIICVKDTGKNLLINKYDGIKLNIEMNGITKLNIKNHFELFSKKLINI